MRRQVRRFPFIKGGEARIVLEYVESREYANTPRTCQGYVI
jgi:hypothetical protein